MPHSLRAKLSGLRYKGIIEDKDYKRLCHALDLEKEEQEPCENCCNGNQIEKAKLCQKSYLAGMEHKQEPCEDAVSRQAVLNEFYDVENLYNRIKQLPSVRPQEPKTGHCKDCKWWKDSDGLYRRGNHAESQCPINRREVFEGNGYCYMYEPQESEEV